MALLTLSSLPRKCVPIPTTAVASLSVVIHDQNFVCPIFRAQFEQNVPANHDKHPNDISPIPDETAESEQQQISVQAE